MERGKRAVFKPVNLSQVHESYPKHLLIYFTDVKLHSINDGNINQFFESKKNAGMSEVAIHMLLMLLKKLLQLGGVDTIKLSLERTVHMTRNKRTVEIMQQEEWRKLSVPKSVFKILLKSKKPTGYVLECKEGKLPDPRREQFRPENLFEKLEMTEYSFHTLRDIFVVKCLQAGMSIENLSYVLGHASVTITANRYKEFMNRNDERRRMLRKIMELV